MTTELDQLTQLCVRLGAAPPQAATMAAQLLKRADQLAVERSIPRASALAYLIDITTKARNGEVPLRPDDAGRRGPERS